MVCKKKKKKKKEHYYDKFDYVFFLFHYFKKLYIYQKMKPVRDAPPAERACKQLVTGTDESSS